MLQFASLVAVTAVSLHERPHGSEPVTLLQSKLVHVDNYVEVTKQAVEDSNQTAQAPEAEQGEEGVDEEVVAQRMRRRFRERKRRRTAARRKKRKTAMLRRKRSVRMLITHLDTDESATLNIAELMTALTDDENKVPVQDALDLLLGLGGKVTWQQIQDARSADGDELNAVIQGIFGVIDNNTDGSLSFVELVATDCTAILELYMAMPIRHLDTDGSGTLNLMELMTALTDNDNKAHVTDALNLLTGGEVTWRWVQDARSARGEDLGQMIQGIFQVIDTNSDSSLSVKEIAAINFTAIYGLFRSAHFVMLISNLDTDESGTLNLEEVMKALTDDNNEANVTDALVLLTGGEVTRQGIQDAGSAAEDKFGGVIMGIFQLIDTNTDNSLSVEELAAIVDFQPMLDLFETMASNPYLP